MPKPPPKNLTCANCSHKYVVNPIEQSDFWGNFHGYTYPVECPLCQCPYTILNNDTDALTRAVNAQLIPPIWDRNTPQSTPHST